MIKIETGTRTIFAATLEEALEAGAPVEAAEAALLAERRKAVSAECRRRIYTAASAEAQMNMAVASGVVAGKAASARSPEEKAVLDGARAALDWVTAMRQRAQELAASGADFHDDTAWPALPPEVAAVVAQF